MKLIELNHMAAMLGWTLLHSLWQGLVVYVVFRLLRKFTLRTSSTVRYAISSGSLAIIVLSACFTFFHDPHVPIGGPVVGATAPSILNTAVHTLGSGTYDTSWIPSAVGWVDQHLWILIMAWAAGVFFFGIRLTTSWWSSTRLEKHSEAVGGEWNDRMTALADSIGVKCRVLLRQCASVCTPIVLGLVRPAILLPVGMLEGLTTEQVEAILLHELAHIRRHDYLINILQSYCEVIFFFNPFVWLISGEIRADREECCDDIVVREKNPLAYAKALHRLEEDRLWSAGVSLAATGNRNQLLRRIQRIMKTTDQKNSSRKLYPALLSILMISGLLWVSMAAGLSKPAVLAVRDTVIRDSVKKETLRKIADKKTARYSRRSVTTSDEHGQPHETVSENVYGDTDLLSSEPLNFDFAGPPAAEFTDPVLAMNFDNFAPNFPGMDTLPQRFDGMTEKDWEQFGRQFSEEFRERFQDFYKKNGPEFEKMMKDLEVRMQGLQEKAGELAQIAAQHHADFSVQSAQLAEELSRAAREQGRAYRQQYGVQQERNRQAQQEANRNLRKASRDLHSMDQFQEVLQDELKKDGYLGKDEVISTFDLSDHDMSVNGKKIKEKDKEKYDRLRHRYLEAGGDRHHTE